MKIMWLDYIENPEVITSVFKQKIPLLSNLTITSMEFLVGYDLHLQITVELNQMPQNIPVSWQQLNVDNVVVVLGFDKVSVNNISNFQSSMDEATIKISSAKENLVSEIYDDNSDLVISFLTKKIYVVEIEEFCES